MDKASGAERVARNLHDQVIQRLFAAGLLLRVGLGQVEDEALRSRLSRCADLLDVSVEALRTAIVDLQSLGEVWSLRRRLLDVVAEFAETRAVSPVVRMAGPVDTVVPAETQRRAEGALRAVLRAFADRPDLSIEVRAGDELVLDVTGGGAPSEGVQGWERTPTGLRWRASW